ncbi:hypothetical protein BJ138DRAFT_1160403 [Hygrophoropsis aurantiaca]|uniref:Uncharacterized protein n=1 Tax=Hygrophoropsis aurantiaca TaxID=72124 RepID=A0ACB8A1L1_9AGAM|nr:hypothetical protein BJ138DRAFT_1160403 [Hygrophoropsis aurantiaca]
MFEKAIQDNDMVSAADPHGLFVLFEPSKSYNEQLLSKPARLGDLAQVVKNFEEKFQEQRAAHEEEKLTSEKKFQDIYNKFQEVNASLMPIHLHALVDKTREHIIFHILNLPQQTTWAKFATSGNRGDLILQIQQGFIRNNVQVQYRPSLDALDALFSNADTSTENNTMMYAASQQQMKNAVSLLDTPTVERTNHEGYYILIHRASFDQ